MASPAESFKLSTAIKDTGLYFTAPLRWDLKDWSYFGGAVLAVGAAHHYDEEVRAHYAVGSKAQLDGNDPNDRRDMLPAVAMIAGTWAYATLIDDADGYKETWSLLEAGGLTTLSGLGLKYLAGRQRPNETTDPNAWREGGTSFPSTHVNIAFAVGTVLAESGSDRYRWIRRTLGYGIAATVAYNRVHDNAHWLSDTVAGAALGMASARFVLNRRNAEKSEAAVFLAPIDNGLMLTYSMPLH